MPYYSVHIRGGDDYEQRGREVRESLRGQDADYKREANFFYVQRKKGGLKDLEALVQGMVGAEYDVSVHRILKSEFEWRKDG